MSELRPDKEGEKRVMKADVMSKIRSNKHFRGTVLSGTVVGTIPLPCNG